MSTSSLPEVWLRGAVAGYPAELQPVVHALLQAQEDVEATLAPLAVDEIWATPGGAASIGFHARHLVGALDRLFTYARGLALSEPQLVYLKGEGVPGDPPADGAELFGLVRSGITAALGQLRATAVSELAAPRAVGRKLLPTTVRGLLFHGAEHCTRHAGQMITTAKIVRNT
jgi:DinB family protein